MNTLKNNIYESLVKGNAANNKEAIIKELNKSLSAKFSTVCTFEIYKSCIDDWKELANTDKYNLYIATKKLYNKLHNSNIVLLEYVGSQKMARFDKKEHICICVECKENSTTKVCGWLIYVKDKDNFAWQPVAKVGKEYQYFTDEKTIIDMLNKL